MSKGEYNDLAIIKNHKRKQAFQKGLLIDVSKIAKKAGFITPMAITSSVFEMLSNASKDDKELYDRLNNLITLMAIKIREVSIVNVDFIISSSPKPTHLKPVLGHDDQGNPAITILLTTEN